MADAYTTRNRFTKQEVGANENTWGDILNTVIDLVDESTDGVLEVDVSASNKTLSTNNGASDQARNRFLKLTGEPGADRTITIPDVEKSYFVEVALSGSNNVTIKNTSDNTGVTLSAGSGNTIVVCDGTSTRRFLGAADTSGLLVATSNLADLTDVSAARDNLGLGSMALATSAGFTNTIFDLMYPVGTIYTNYSVGTNPGTLLGRGTWVAVGQGRVLVGAGQGTDVNANSVTFTATSTGGEYTHTLTTTEMPSHRHRLWGDNAGANGTPIGGISGKSVLGLENETAYYDTAGNSSTPLIENTGGGAAHNIQQPWLAVFMWRRTG